MLADACRDVIREWAGKGLAGLRIFTGGSTKDFDPSELDNPSSFKAWELLAELGLPMCIQTGPIGLPQVTHAGQKFPNVNIILDHLGRPDVLDGPPYANAASLFDWPTLPNIYLKLTPRIFGDVKKEQGQRRDLLPARGRGLRRAAPGLGLELPDLARHAGGDPGDGAGGLACLGEEDRAWIFGKTAQQLYPALA
jgi:L-fuconolactonase